MVFCSAILLTLKLTAGYSDGFAWKLAFNINPDDGHNFGYGASAWDDTIDVGNDTYAFAADYKSYDVALETANFIAIIRHQDGVCEAARVWKFLEVGKTLHEYMNLKENGRLVATEENCTSSYISPTMANKDSDPIFALDGALVFNWWHSDNGVRIANSNAHCKTGLPGTGENTDSFFGLGNEVSASNAKDGVGSNSYWSDVAVQDCSSNYKNRVQGSDHGYLVADGEVYGQYAVYVSEDAETFVCNNLPLSTGMYGGRYLSDFHRAERDSDGVNFMEYVFDKADLSKDGVISQMEYSTARWDHRFVKTAFKDVLTDFTRIDKNGDGVLDFDEMEFDSADMNKDGELSYQEYYIARLAQDNMDNE